MGNYTKESAKMYKNENNMAGNKKKSEKTGELTHVLLWELYKNSRLSLREFGRRLGVSYHTVSALLEELEGEYRLVYTLNLDSKKLGFSNGEIITIKFESMPNLIELKERLKNDIFVQEAYLASGDFDIVMYVVGLTQEQFQEWQFKLRMELGDYKPRFRFSTANEFNIGFFKLRNELIEQSTMLTPLEKRVLSLLNDNSRIRLRDLIKSSGSTQMKVVYVMKKLQDGGFIKGFSAMVQNPEKRIFMGFCGALQPNKEHTRLSYEFSKARLDEEFNSVTSDYCIEANVSGRYDWFSIATFRDLESISKRGPDAALKIWEVENPKINKAILNDVIVGIWPFHQDHYESYRRGVEEMEKRF